MPGPPIRFGRYREIAAGVASLVVTPSASERSGGAGGPLTGALAPPTLPPHSLAGATIEVLVASSAVADSIRRELLARVPAGLAGIRLQTLESLARRILNDANEFPRVAGDAERRLAMRTAIRKIDDPMMESRGMAAMIERSYRDARDSGLTLREVESRVRSTRGLRNPARTRILLDAWREYERIVAGMGGIDPASLFDRAAALVPKSSVAPQIVAGFYDMTGVQQKLIAALQDAGRLAAIFVPIDEDAEEYRFAQRFVAQFRAERPEPRLPIAARRAPHCDVIEHDTRQSELREVCREIRALLDRGVAPDSIGIVVRSIDEYDVHLINRYAADAGFRTSRAGETPLLAHRLGRGLASLLRIREQEFPRAEVLELARDGFRPKNRLELDAVDLATRRARIAGGTSASLRTVQKRPYIADYLEFVAELESLTAPFASPIKGTEWSDTLTRLASRFQLETELDLQAAERIDDVAELFRRAGELRFDAGAVLDALDQLTLRQPDGPAAQPVVFLGELLRFRGRSFEHLFAIRMQEDVFPQRRVEDPLLPDADRRLLGIREIGNGRDEEQLLFQLLLDSSEHVHFRFAGTDGFAKVLRKSPLLRKYATSRRDAEPPAAGTPALRPLQLLVHSGTRSVFDGYLLPNDRFAAALQKVSPTHLEDFGECPQKFLLKHILGVRDLDDPEREVQINHRDKGTLDHRILERFYSEVRAADLERAAVTLPKIPDDLEHRLDAIIDDEFDRLEAEAPPFNRTMRDIERRATRRILQEFVAVDFAELIANGLVPYKVEYCFGSKYVERGIADHPESFVVTAGGIPIHVDGRIDRIDAGDDDVYRIVDYKSGKALRHANLGHKIDDGVRLQLALYALAVAEFFNVDPAAVRGAIKPLVISETRAEKYAFALGDKRERLQETLDLFARAILNGRFPAFPNEKDEDFNSCKYCPVNHSCRTKHEAEEKYAVVKHKNPRTLLELAG